MLRGVIPRERDPNPVDKARAPSNSAKDSIPAKTILQIFLYIVRGALLAGREPTNFGPRSLKRFVAICL
jgi:hypothetical protein